MASRVGFAIAVIAAACLAGGVGADATTPPKGDRLVAFRSCPDLLRSVKAQAARFVTPYGLGGSVDSRGVPGVAAAPGSTPQQGVDYSGTNVQEAGVDEPDVVKTNGATLFAVEGGRLESVAVGGGQPRLLDTVKLDGGWSHELLLFGTHLLVLSRGGYWIQPLPAMPAMMSVPQASSSTLTEVDISDPAKLEVVQKLILSGAYVDARMIGATVRVVSSSSLPGPLSYETPSDSTAGALAAAQAKNRAVVASSPLAAWLPTYRLGNKPARPLVSCRDVRRPPSFSGVGMLTVTTIDLAKGLVPVDSTGIMTDARIVYASPKTLYVATEPWSARPLPAAPARAASASTTQIHAFDISDPAKTTYLGSGAVPGYLLSQWSLSEFQRVLRVVSTDTPAWWGTGPASESYLTALRLQNGRLTQLGRLGGLGRGDRVYAVRMIGDTGYVVTFKQVDPLYTIDLRVPAQPKLVGQLDLPGYSSYLHPISDNLLLGIGQNVDPQTSERAGTQVSLFDVSNPGRPTRLYHATLGQGWSAAESDHHAFLYWPATRLLVVPFGQQAVAMHISRTAGITEFGRIVHTRARQSQLPQIDRSVVVGKALLTVSSGGVASNGLTSLASLGWAAFPPPTPGPQPVPLPYGLITSDAVGSVVAVAPS
jgi:uncharacterized secreted protein with C-terminal beta-propeller domain